jgi:hypothetical protein
METQRNLMRVASLLFCLHLLFIGVGKVGARSSSTGKADAHQADCLLCVRLDSNGCLQKANRRYNPALEPYQPQPQSQQTSLGSSDLFEEETDSSGHNFNNNAPHLLIPLSDPLRRSSTRMTPAGGPTRLYLVNRTLLC